MEKDFPEMVKEHTEVVFLKSKNLVIITQKAKKKGSNCMEESLSYGSGSSLSLSFPFPKIPFVILRDFIAVAKFYGEAELEVHADVYLQNGKYFLDFPQQYVHKYWVQVIESSVDIVSRVEDAIKVLEIHSV